MKLSIGILRSAMFEKYLEKARSNIYFWFWRRSLKELFYKKILVRPRKFWSNVTSVLLVLWAVKAFVKKIKSDPVVNDYSISVILKAPDHCFQSVFKHFHH